MTGVIDAHGASVPQPPMAVSGVPSLTVDPSHGMATDPFQMTYSVSCEFQNFDAQFTWDGAVFGTTAPLGACPPGSSTLSVTVTSSPPSTGNDAGDHTIIASAGFARGSSFATRSTTSASATYTIDSPATAAPTGSPPTAAPTPGPGELAASDVGAFPSLLAGAVIAGVALLLMSFAGIGVRRRRRLARGRREAAAHVGAHLHSAAATTRVSEPSAAITHAIGARAHAGTPQVTVEEVEQ